MGEGRYGYVGILAEMIKRLPVNQAESILKKHWSQVSNFADYVACALYLATPDLLAHAADALKAANDPKEMLAFLSMQFGYRISDRPGITCPEQIEAILPYLDLLSESDIGRFWQACNEHGWYELRRSHLDPLLSSKARGWVYLDDVRVMGALDEMVAEDSRWVEHWIDDFLHTGASVTRLCRMSVNGLVARAISLRSSWQAGLFYISENGDISACSMSPGCNCRNWPPELLPIQSMAFAAARFGRERSVSLAATQSAPPAATSKCPMSASGPKPVSRARFDLV
jgi:hypothetical protein